MSTKYVLIIGVFLSLNCNRLLANTFFVDQKASHGVRTGLDWQNAFRYLQDALTVATAGDKVLVAKGVYYPDQSMLDPNLPRDATASFQLVSGVEIYGGYAGRGTADPNERSFLHDETILDGHTSSGAAVYHIIQAADLGQDAVLDGFTIYEGGINSNIEPMDRGTGAYLRNSRVTFRNCIFSTNGRSIYGGAIYCENGILDVSNCLFYRCNATYGGAIYGSSMQMILRNCTFNRIVGNGWYGLPVHGAIYCRDSDLSIQNSILYSGAEDKEVQLFNSTLKISFCNVKGGIDNIYMDPSSHLTWGDGNMNTPPMYAWKYPAGYPYEKRFNLESAGWQWNNTKQKWEQGWSTSPCIDAGDPSTPIGNEPNTLPFDPNTPVVNTRINLGAFGGTKYASIAPDNWRLVPDLTGDRKVTLADVAEFFADWLKANYNLQGDFDRNNCVNFDDLMFLCDKWLDCNVCSSVVCKAECYDNLRHVETAISQFASDAWDYGDLPPDFNALIVLGYNPEFFKCPNRCNFSQTGSYVYRGSGLNEDTHHPKMVVVYDRYENHAGMFRNVVFLDSPRECLTEQEFQAAIAFDNAYRASVGLPVKPAE